MASRFRKRLYLLCFCLILLLGCATKGDIEELREEVYQMMGTSVGAKFYPARGLTGGAAGDLDKITGTVDGDVGFVVLHDDATLNDRVLIYVLDADSACGGDDAGTLPKYFQAADGGNECWELARIGNLESLSPMKVKALSGGSETLDLDEVMNTYLYVTVAADYTLRKIGTGSNQVPQGSQFCIHPVGAIQVDIDPNGSDSITLDGTEDTNGDRIESPATSGALICLVACASDGWCAPSNPYGWTAGGV